MKKIIAPVLILSYALVAHAQQGVPPGPPGWHPDHPPMETTRPLKSYPDSVEFKKQFAELYPLIQLVPGPRERAEITFDRMSRMFKGRGVDSAKAYDSVMKAIDPKSDETTLYNAYRSEFTAEELKGLVTFFKTPTGKHYFEVEPHLANARTIADSYVNRTVQRVVYSMGKPVETPPGLPGRPMRPGMHPGMRPAPGSAPTNPPQPPTPAPAPQGGNQ